MAMLMTFAADSLVLTTTNTTVSCTMSVAQILLFIFYIIQMPFTSV